MFEKEVAVLFQHAAHRQGDRSREDEEVRDAESGRNVEKDCFRDAECKGEKL